MANMLSSFKGELKSQGAADAARDPNSSVTANDAQRVMVDESKKAGAPALTFDPNATPEEKQAQARAVSYGKRNLPSLIFADFCRREQTITSTNRREWASPPTLMMEDQMTTIYLLRQQLVQLHPQMASWTRLQPPMASLQKKGGGQETKSVGHLDSATA